MTVAPPPAAGAGADAANQAQRAWRQAASLIASGTHDGIELGRGIIADHRLRVGPAVADLFERRPERLNANRDDRLKLDRMIKAALCEIGESAVPRTDGT